MRIPKKVVLPGGFTVKIRHIDHEDFKEENCADLACFDRDTMTIMLDKGRCKKDRKMDFIHEMDHAFVDWKYWYEKHG